MGAAEARWGWMEEREKVEREGEGVGRVEVKVGRGEDQVEGGPQAESTR